MNSSTRFHIVLRQNLVRWRFDAQLAELLRACEEFGLNEVLLFPHGLDASDCSTGYWPLDEVRKDCDLVAKAKEALARVGVRTGLNVWHTFGHGDRGRDMTGVFPFQPLVDEDGSACKACACPLSQEWQRHMTAAFEMYGSVKPSRIFLDDDFRWFNHGSPFVGGYMTCFCPLHLAAFNQQYGLGFTRETLIREALRPGTPSPVRGQWLDFLCNAQVRIAGLLGDAVRRVSPETEMGLMCSYPDQHALEGRDWRRLMEALCGKGRVALLRPHFPDYMEGSLCSVPANLLITRHTIAQLPRDRVLHFPELDNCLPTPYNRSPDYIAFQTMIAATLGLGQFHYSLFEFMGNPDTFEEGREYGEMLRRIRPHVETVLGITAGTKRECGVQLLNNPRSVYTLPTTAGREWKELFFLSPAMGGTLQLLGFPVTFEESPVVAAHGTMLSTLDDAQIRKLLAKNLLLESSAAAVLVQRGFGDQIGITAVRHGDPEHRTINCERIVDETDPLRGHLVRCQGFSHLRDTFFTLCPDAQVVTEMVGIELKPRGPGMIRFTNALGGRIVVCNASLAEFDSLTYLNPVRRHLLERALDFLHGKTPRICVRNAPLVLPLHIELNNGVFLAVGNVRTSDAKKMEIVCRDLATRSIDAWQFSRGELKPLAVASRRDGNDSVVTLDGSIPPLGIAFVKLT